MSYPYVQAALSRDRQDMLRTVIPYDAYRLYQIQRTKSSAEIQRADEQAARTASGLAALFQVITRRRRIVSYRQARIRCQSAPGGPGWSAPQ